jgi:hypothetical protein
MSEELKIIMDTLAALGEAGKAGFIWWLVIKHGVPAILTFIGFCVGAFALYKIVMVINYHGDDAVALRQIATLLGTTEYGYAKRAATYEKVRELMERAK